MSNSDMQSMLINRMVDGAAISIDEIIKQITVVDLSKIIFRFESYDFSAALYHGL